MFSLAFFRIAPQLTKRLQEAGFSAETNQRFFKEPLMRNQMINEAITNTTFIVSQYA